MNRSSLQTRLQAAAVALVCLGLLVVASRLSASPEGHGTHEQLGLPPCQFAMRFDVPCFTCGMTTAFAHAADGRPIESARAQPLGFLLALGTAVGFWASLHVAAAGSAIGAVAAGLVRGKVLWLLVAAAGSAWVYKWMVWESIPLAGGG